MYDTTGKIFGLALKGVLAGRERGTQARLAKALGKESSYIADIKNGRGAGTEETRRYIASFLGYGYEDMLRMGREIADRPEDDSRKKFSMPEHVAEYGQQGLTRVPFLEAVPTMGGESLQLSRQVKSHLAFRTDWLRTKGGPGSMVVVRADGDSMAPTIEDGSIVLCDESRTEFADNRVFLVEHQDGIVIKRLRKRGDTVLMVSDNGGVEQEIRGEDHFRIIARCIWTAKELD
ncbi:S24 family peptidase [Desulfohalovibrio reitneri]|uniref:S24 family peptidase n=1 Tax=Desulfohalovibrio reitneri TaxID=1307759 RepID=UPI0004A6ED0B|nr:S24 family peptidase [Desulfohalovibrio reitneri]